MGEYTISDHSIQPMVTRYTPNQEDLFLGGKRNCWGNLDWLASESDRAFMASGAILTPHSPQFLLHHNTIYIHYYAAGVLHLHKQKKKLNTPYICEHVIIGCTRSREKVQASIGTAKLSACIHNMQSGTIRPTYLLTILMVVFKYFTYLCIFILYAYFCDHGCC